MKKRILPIFLSSALLLMLVSIVGWASQPRQKVHSVAQEKQAIATSATSNPKQEIKSEATPLPAPKLKENKAEEKEKEPRGRFIKRNATEQLA